MKWICLVLAIFLIQAAVFAPRVEAVEGSVLGIHILTPSEASSAKELLKKDAPDDSWHYVTIPLTLSDLHKQDEWQNFFRYARENKIIPIVRLTTRFENGAWQIPSKKEVVDQVTFLSSLEWPTDEKYIIVFNEVNHAKEWGGRLDPAAYAEVLRFSSNWAKSEGKNYKVLPAAMDLAAPNSSVTMEAFTFLEGMHQADANIFEYVDDWNSHSYPNPAFSSPPTANGKNSLRGYVHELEYLKRVTGREYRVFITETGWVENRATRAQLASYYNYAAEQIWSDPRIKAVTPFVLQGDPGPFSGFTFVNRNGQPTLQYIAFQQAKKKLDEKKRN